MKVLQVDQWSSTGNFSGLTLEDFEKDPTGSLQKVKGGDAEELAPSSAVRRESRRSTNTLVLPSAKCGFAKWMRNWKCGRPTTTPATSTHRRNDSLGNDTAIEQRRQSMDQFKT